MQDQPDAPTDEVYTLEEAADIIQKAVDRKKGEIAALEKRRARLKKDTSIAANQALIDYLKSDLTSYISVLADMRDDNSLLEGLDVDADSTPEPDDYQSYIDGLSADDLENELDADFIRAEYCDDALRDLCTRMGESTLRSKKMIKALLDDPYALEQIGEVVYYDEYLSDLLMTITAEKDEKKDKKKKKK